MFLSIFTIQHELVAVVTPIVFRRDRHSDQIQVEPYLPRFQNNNYGYLHLQITLIKKVKILESKKFPTIA